MVYLGLYVALEAINCLQISNLLFEMLNNRILAIIPSCTNVFVFFLHHVEKSLLAWLIKMDRNFSQAGL